MGSDAAIYVFDYSKYASEVVPALHQLLLTGEVVPPLHLIVKQRRASSAYDSAEDVTLLRNIDLLGHCTYLTPELAPRFLPPAAQTKPHLKDWNVRACQSEQCPLRGWCPFHLQRNHSMVEELNHALRAVVKAQCLGKSLFVGRTMNPGDYRELLDHLQTPPEHPVRALLKPLATRGFVIGFRWSLTGEGIHGWLKPDETEQLLAFLGELPLPQYELDTKNIESLLKVRQARDMIRLEAEGIIKGRIAFRAEPISPALEEAGKAVLESEWYALSLSFVRTIASMAAAQGKGIMWGNDL